MTDRSIAYKDLWKWYLEAEDLPDRRAEILHVFNLTKNLPHQSWQDQLLYLDNCPEDIIKAHKKLLKPEAARKLGFEAKAAKVEKVKKFNWEILC